MTYFKDLDLVRYHRGPCCADDWHCPLLAVGWLESGHNYPTGVCPPRVTERLAELRAKFAAAFPAFSFRGWHSCSMCDGGVELLRDSHINLFIPGLDVLYLTTGRADHYIDFTPMFRQWRLSTLSWCALILTRPNTKLHCSD